MKTSGSNRFATCTGDTHAESKEKLWAIDNLGPLLPRSAAERGLAGKLLTISIYKNGGRDDEFSIK
jgi:hypothetical protein